MRSRKNPQTTRGAEREREKTPTKRYDDFNSGNIQFQLAGGRLFVDEAKTIALLRDGGCAIMVNLMMTHFFLVQIQFKVI